MIMAPRCSGRRGRNPTSLEKVAIGTNAFTLYSRYRRAFLGTEGAVGRGAHRNAPLYSHLRKRVFRERRRRRVHRPAPRPHHQDWARKPAQDQLRFDNPKTGGARSAAATWLHQFDQLTPEIERHGRLQGQFYRGPGTSRARSSNPVRAATPSAGSKPRNDATARLV